MASGRLPSAGSRGRRDVVGREKRLCARFWGAIGADQLIESEEEEETS